MKIELNGQIFKKHSNIKFHKNSSSRSRVFFHADERTDRQTWQTCL